MTILDARLSSVELEACPSVDEASHQVPDIDTIEVARKSHEVIYGQDLLRSLARTSCIVTDAEARVIQNQQDNAQLDPHAKDLIRHSNWRFRMIDHLGA